MNSCQFNLSFVVFLYKIAKFSSIQLCTTFLKEMKQFAADLNRTLMKSPIHLACFKEHNMHAINQNEKKVRTFSVKSP